MHLAITVDELIGRSQSSGMREQWTSKKEAEEEEEEEEENDTQWSQWRNKGRRRIISPASSVATYSPVVATGLLTAILRRRLYSLLFFIQLSNRY